MAEEYKLVCPSCNAGFDVTEEINKWISKLEITKKVLEQIKEIQKLKGGKR